MISKQFAVVVFLFVFFVEIWQHEIEGLLGLIIGAIAGIAAESEGKR